MQAHYHFNPKDMQLFTDLSRPDSMYFDDDFVYMELPFKMMM